MEELHLTDEELINFIEGRSEKLNPLNQIQNDELKKWLEILFVNLHKPTSREVTKYKEILDPNNNGTFDFCTLLALVAEKTEEFEHAMEEKTQSKGDEKKYTLRPRKCLKKPSKMRYYDY